MARILVLLVLAFALALPYAGSYLVIDRPLPSDAIVVLAGDVDSSRVNRGLDALKAGLGRELFVDADSRRALFGRTMAQYAQAYIQTLPPEQAAHIHVCPVVGTSTFAESAEVAQCLAPLQPRRVLLVTSAYHTRRALSTFERRLPQYQWSVAAAYDESEFRQDYWKNREWLKTTVQEWMKLAFWELVERWKSTGSPTRAVVAHAGEGALA
jgi:hypothetical protein